jgi:hypothetical protein
MSISFNDLLNSKITYVAYNAAIETHSSENKKYNERLINDQAIIELINELQSWPGPQINSHKSANQFFHKLVFLADIGIKHSTPGIRQIADKILSNIDVNGVPCLPMNIGVAYGGTGSDINGWALCDAPNILYALVKFGFIEKSINNAIHYLADLISQNGFGCRVANTLGNWRGPGKKSDPCPYATLIMLKLLLLFETEFKKQISICADSLLDLWEYSHEKHPYIFYMGTDFRKLKLPFIWYDIIHVTDVLSQIKEYRKDLRLKAMYNIIKNAETEKGYTPESIYQPWKRWDFGQKKLMSEWLTFCVMRIEKRLTTVNH